MKKEDKELHNREVLAIANYCRSFLYYGDFLSESENNKVHDRIKKFQDNNKISISPEQVDSVDVNYSGK